MFRRRRRGSGGRWLPVSSAPNSQITVASTKTTGVGGNWVGDESLNAANLIIGQASASLLTGVQSTAAELGGGIFHKRTVGFVDAVAHQGQAFDSHGIAFFGIFVDRVDNNDVLQNLGAWQGWSAASRLKRWLFRRTWHLSNPASTVAGADAQVAPPSASEYAALGGGTTIDCKSKAKITWEERLFYMYMVSGLSPNVANGTTFVVSFYPDLRTFGRLYQGGNR